jgi:D-glycero-D-manno-heptose 1,7-bisphosphate phosphatase
MDQKKFRQKVVFLDRDGVINQDSPDYIKSWSEFEFIPGSLEAIKQLYLNRYLTIVITNQSAVNRKIITNEKLEHIHKLMISAVKSYGGQIKDIFFCPHAPQEKCSCRKPNPGLINKAKRTYMIDLSTATMVGDNVKDIECARNAGCGRTILVRTGNGEKAEKILMKKAIYPDYVAQNLLEAVKWIIAYGKKTSSSDHT